MNINLNEGFSKLTTFAVSGEHLSDFDVNWGDGTISDSWPHSHIYSSSGDYNVNITGASGASAITITENLCVSDYIVPSIQIDAEDSFAYTGAEGGFVATVNSLQPNITLHFYASGSDSKPYSTPELFWDHLDPRWRFLDMDDNIISTATFSGSPIIVDTVTVAYSADYPFKYVDDMPSDVVLFVTQEIPNHNSRVYSALPYSILAEIPTTIRITEDGINPIHDIQWDGVPIPYVISFGNANSKIIHYVGINSVESGSSLYAYATILSARFSSICSVISDEVHIEPINITDENCFYTGGYVLTSTVIAKGQIDIPTTSINQVECNNEELVTYSEYRIPAREAKITVVAEVSFDGNVVTLSGVSNTFSVYPFEEYHKFRRLGESEDLGDKLKYYSFTDRMKNYSGLWDYVDAIMGSDRKSLGSKSFFGIDRFVDQHADIDRCNLKSIVDSAKEIGVTVDDYALNDMPYEIKRILDLASIPLEKIVGSRCSCNMNFSNCAGCVGSNICTICGFNKNDNVGDELLLTNYISAGTDILYIENGGSKVYEVLHIVPQGGEDVYLLSTLSASPVYENGVTNYCFFSWDNSFQGNPIESEIDYLSKYTTIDPQLSSVEDWFGDGGIIEELLNFNLIQGLELNS